MSNEQKTVFLFMNQTDYEGKTLEKIVATRELANEIFRRMHKVLGVRLKGRFDITTKKLMISYDCDREKINKFSAEFGFRPSDSVSVIEFAIEEE